MKELAPPYAGEGAHALWHVSEDTSLVRFEPHLRPEHAIDETTDDDVDRFLDGDRRRRVHAIEAVWLEPMRAMRFVAYRVPEEPFEPWDRFWISRTAVEPLELVELGDLLLRHADAEIEPRIVPGLLGLWDKVVNSMLDFSGIRLRTATLAR